MAGCCPSSVFDVSAGPGYLTNVLAYLTAGSGTNEKKN
jgi:hypothetical protein